MSYNATSLQEETDYIKAIDNLCKIRIPGKGDSSAFIFPCTRPRNENIVLTTFLNYFSDIKMFLIDETVLEERKEYENKILELSKLNAELKDKIHDLEDDIMKYQSENDDKNSSLSEKKGEIDELVSKQSDSESKIYDLKYKLDAVRNDLDEINQEKTRL